MIAHVPLVRLVNTSQAILHVAAKRLLQDVNNLVQVRRTERLLQAHKLPYAEAFFGHDYAFPLVASQCARAVVFNPESLPVARARNDR
jgi:hypothetical protein